MRFSRFLKALAVVLFLPAISASADTIATFDLTGTFGVGTPPSIAFGTVTIDTTTGIVQAINLGFQGLASNAVVADTGAESYGPPLNLTEIGETWLGPPGVNYFAGISIDIPVTTLVGYTGGSICSLDNQCAGGTSNVGLGPDDIDFNNGELARTPEPSSFTLLGIGALAMAGMMRSSLLRAFRMRTTPV